MQLQDFRLELDGVLKSWAVPKGPSLDPQDKRLALMTEDHPYDYRTFEGIIPDGNYGAGEVIIWDEGTYQAIAGQSKAEQVQVLREGLAAGHITFILDGRKLKGEFALIKIRGQEGSGKDGNAWLLVKAGDAYESQDDITALDESVVSGKRLNDLAGPDISRLPKVEMPHNLSPMLATLADQPFDHPGWFFEIKYDGYRILAEVKANQVKLWSRNRQDYTKVFSPVAEALRSLGHEAVLDGEMVVLDEENKSRFQLLQNYQKTGQGNAVFYVFDILYLDGHDLRELPLIDRKTLLQSVLFETSKYVRYSDHIEGQGKAFFELAAQQSLEGIIAKNSQSRYEAGRRSRNWLKIKTTRRQEVVVGGFTEPTGSRQGLGSLILGLFEEGKLKFAGHSGGSFAGLKPEELREQLEEIETSKCPFDPVPSGKTVQHWVKPVLVCEVEFSEWTKDGSMRHPKIVGFRLDKAAEEVVKELPAEPVLPSRSGPESKLVTTIGGHRLKLTNLDKLYWPDDGYTKGDLIEYYRSVAKWIIPYLEGRPQSLNRFPNGIKGESFYQKDVDIAPHWIANYNVRSGPDQNSINYVVCNDEASLIWLANLGCIEMNVWNARIESIDKPDYAVIDLDPEGIAFEAVVEAALVTKQVLDEVKVESYCKTSGATGLHIYVPMGAKYSYDQSRQFSQLVAMLVHQRLPKTTSLERSPAKRQQKVYLDYLQNRRGQTMAAPYCVRPRPGAPVSAPLGWDELTSKLDPTSYTIATIHERLNVYGDLWKPTSGPGIDLAAVLSQLG
jgi:bifunctional non-homologous end joining protein LigD